MINRIYVEKKAAVSRAAGRLCEDLNALLGLSLTAVRVFLRYDVEDLPADALKPAVQTIFSEPPVDDVYFDDLPPTEGGKIIATEFLPGQYDQRADSASQCVQLLTQGARPPVRCATVYVFFGAHEEEMVKLLAYLVNPVDSREASMSLPDTLVEAQRVPENIRSIEGFRAFGKAQIAQLHKDMGLAMTLADLAFVQASFKGVRRDPTETELRVLDTYWSDHCRHTTFLTALSAVGHAPSGALSESYAHYLALRDEVYAGKPGKYPCLMDIATIGAKALKKRGKLPMLDESEEINACSIKVKAETTAGVQDWLVMFKNETHNHPTEIEPFGGAATCLGGAIRDPLSGRAYVCHAMRVTGAGDVTASLSETLIGKLPQRVITREAARGFSSYGNQIGLATGMVSEVYHPGYTAKRLECGFVVGGVEAKNVVREEPVPGDVILLIGGETGRDGCGGATGSSKEHGVGSLATCGAEVQKGNALTERKLQRLFRNPAFSRLVKRCNDFGAGGVCVAIGELADGLTVDLDKVPKKYDGLTGTELAISESQERMAVVVSAADADEAARLCDEENLDATAVAVVTAEPRMRMLWRGAVIVDLSRALLSSNGAPQTAYVSLNDTPAPYLFKASDGVVRAGEACVFTALSYALRALPLSLNKGMSEMFDSTIGTGSVLLPWGGKTQTSPAIAAAALLPTYPNATKTCTVTAWGYDPYLSSESPFLGAQYAILAAVTKAVCAGAVYNTVHLTLQEFFPKTKNDPARWGLPAAALLGALRAQMGLEIGAIGGKDSMSGSFLDLDVPPTLIAFALGIGSADKVLAGCLNKAAKSDKVVYRVAVPRDAAGNPDLAACKKTLQRLSALVQDGRVEFATVVEAGGALVALTKAALGDRTGFRIDGAVGLADLFAPAIGDILVVGKTAAAVKTLKGVPFAVLDKDSENVTVGGDYLALSALGEDALATLDKVFATKGDPAARPPLLRAARPKTPFVHKCAVAQPKVLLPVFPGTNGEYDLAKKFIEAGAEVQFLVVKNRKPAHIAETADALVRALSSCQIVAFPGGFSGGDEPDGSGKFIATTFRSPAVADARERLLRVRDGWVFGVCNGFQALIKLGLLPYGRIAPMLSTSPTLYFNHIGRHVSTVVETRITSVKSPWLSKVKLGGIYAVPVSHGEGRLIAPETVLHTLRKNGQIFSQYVDEGGVPTGISPYNPNGAMCAIEGLISPDGRVLGRMGHIERTGENLLKNIRGNMSPDILGAGVAYYR
ncbi:MAG: phosphoribosylformylglycinamidine synthase [Clostridiales bacterium]|jgi:phosphoribosylformylglycinamidine synthase|nr:phosphoribosylformylglycinamidine synthase [Clostridiales bacterium]